MNLCLACLRKGFCSRRRTQLVTDAELSNWRFRWDMRKKAFSLGYTPVDWVEAIHDLYGQYPGWIADDEGRGVFLDMEEFDRPYIREWFRDYVCTLPSNPQSQRLNSASKERIRILATILRGHYPGEARVWGLEVANDL